MSIRTAFAALALSLALSPVFAGDQSVAVESNGTASFIGTLPVLDGGDDVISFTGIAPGTYNFQVSIAGFDIHLTSLTFNNVVGTVIANDTFLFAGVSGSGTSPFALTLTGSTLTSQAHYSGQMSVSAVPEPAPVALLIAGLGLMGVVAKRRKI